MWVQMKLRGRIPKNIVSAMSCDHNSLQTEQEGGILQPRPAGCEWPCPGGKRQLPPESRGERKSLGRYRVPEGLAAASPQGPPWLYGAGGTNKASTSEHPVPNLSDTHHGDSSSTPRSLCHLLFLCSCDLPRGHLDKSCLHHPNPAHSALQ